MDLISIIVPMFNVEKYINQCLLSIVNQTYKNIEIIVIDNNSKDNSYCYVSKIKKKYENIKLIKEKKQGVSYARNKGINFAKGEYIFFVDADDYLSPDLIENLYNFIKLYKLDVAKIPINESLKTDVISIMSSNQIKDKFLRNNKYNSIFEMISLKKLKSNKIYFDSNLLCGEDLLFNYTLYKKDFKFGFISLYGYHYGSNENGITKNLNLKNAIKRCEDLLYVMSIIYNDLIYPSDKEVLASRFFLDINNYIKKIIYGSSSIKQQYKILYSLNQKILNFELINYYKRTKYENYNSFLSYLLYKKQLIAYLIAVNIIKYLKKFKYFINV